MYMYTSTCSGSTCYVETYVELTETEKTKDNGESSNIEKARQVYDVPKDDTTKKLVVPPRLSSRSGKNRAKKLAAARSRQVTPPLPGTISVSQITEIYLRD